MARNIFGVTTATLRSLSYRTAENGLSERNVVAQVRWSRQVDWIQTKQNESLGTATLPIACGQFLVHIVAGINFLEESPRRGSEYCPRRQLQYIASPTTELDSIGQTHSDGTKPR
jgi:hypothetical protein